MSLIELSDITFSYEGEDTPVFRNLSLSVEKGECLVIEGENGSGKTTLFRILNGLSFPQAGSYVFDGKNITKKYLQDNSNAKTFHKEIGYLFQNPDVMLFNATVYDEIAFGPRQMGLGEEDVRRRTNDCMKLFELEKLAEKAPYHLSGGQKKKVAIASVMALNPKVVIFDEPFAGLDKKSRDLLMDFLDELKTVGKTLLIATHDSMICEKIGDRTLILG